MSDQDWLGGLTCAHVPHPVFVDLVPILVCVIAQQIFELGRNLALHRLLGNELPNRTPWIVKVDPHSRLQQTPPVLMTITGISSLTHDFCTSCISVTR